MWKIGKMRPLAAAPSVVECHVIINVIKCGWFAQMVKAVSPTRILVKLQKRFQSTFEFIGVQSSMFAVSSVWLKGRFSIPKKKFL